MKIAGDFSRYNDLNDAQWDILGKVMDGVIIRMGFGVTIDNMANAHIAQAKRLGKPYIGYFWSDPTRTIADQVALVKRAVDLFKPAAVYLDAEQYWRDWAAYMRQDLNEAYRTRFTPAQLNSFYLKNYQATKAALTIPVGNYSADWFVNRYAPDMAKWIYDSPNYWEARYLRYYDPNYWITVKRRFPVDVAEVKVIAGNSPIVRGTARQFESYIEIKGLTTWHGWHQDWNKFTDNSFAVMFGQSVPAPPVPPVPVPTNQYRVTAWLLAVRVSPGGTIIWSLTLKKGQIVEVTEVVGVWAHLKNGYWCGVNYLEKV